MNNLLILLSSGLLFGFISGISPGPLLILTISETLKSGYKAGIKVSLSPIITDLPIILFILLLFNRLSSYSEILGIIGLCGALFLIYLAIECLNFKEIKIDIEKTSSGSLKKGVITNFLNPHPYLFWFTVGIPTVIKAYKTSFIYSLIFILCFYSTLIGSKILITLFVQRSRKFISGRIYFFIIKISGILLILFSILLICDGLKYFKIF